MNNDTYSLIAEDNLDLTCAYGGIPLPSASWHLDGSIIDDSDPSISITTSNISTTLYITNIGDFGGGLYQCNFSNIHGTLEWNVTTVRIKGELAVIKELCY